MIAVTCHECKSEFKVFPYRIRRGNVQFCSNSCSRTFRNFMDNPSKQPEVRAKISANHADVSGAKNPMFGKVGKDCPGYVDGRRSFADAPYRGKMLANRPHICEECKKSFMVENLQVHHIDEDRNNNEFSNLRLLCAVCHRDQHPQTRNELGQFGGGAVCPSD